MKTPKTHLLACALCLPLIDGSSGTFNTQLRSMTDPESRRIMTHAGFVLPGKTLAF